MKLIEIKIVHQNVQELLNYCKRNKIKNLHLNLGLLSNLEILSKEVELINKCTDPELIELEDKAIQLANEKKKAAESAGKKEDYDFKLSVALLSKEDKESYDKLRAVYDESMQENRNVVLEVIDKKQLVQAVTVDDKNFIIPIELGVDESAVLSFFFDAKNWEKKEVSKSDIKADKTKKKK